jgi:Pup amidohydrolase
LDRRANDRRILQRKLGLETEYAFYRRGTHEDPFIFETLMESVRVATPCVPSSQNPFRYFLANGGCISQESSSSESLVAPRCLGMVLESSTPICRSPQQLLEYHSAMRELLVQAIDGISLGESDRLSHGNADATGHTYGQHESYDVQVAKGLSLLGWRLGLILMLPALLIYHGLASIWLLVIWTVAIVMSKAKSDKRQTGQAFRSPLIPSVWIDVCARGMRGLHAPIALLLWCNLWLFALRPYRKALSAFFATRCLIDGAGKVDEAGRFWISHRAADVNCVIGFGSYGRSRPIFRCDSWLRELCMGPGFQWKRYASMFRARRRVEIAIGDSGLCETGQYLRFGVTSLMLDFAERGVVTSSLRLRKSIQAMQCYAKDWMLLARSLDRTGKMVRACEVQLSYLNAAKTMLGSSTRVPDEAWRILELWQTVLHQLDTTDDKSEPSQWLVGRLDWVTKLWVLEHLNQDQATVDAKRKLNLKYHDLTGDGYFEQISKMMEIPRVLTRRAVQRAKGNPPSDDADAMRRSYLIREFSDSASQLIMDRERAQWVSNGAIKTARFSS